MQKFATAVPVTAVVNIAAGRIQITAGDLDEATVEVRPLNPGKNRDVKTAGQTEVVFADGVLRVGDLEPKKEYFGTIGEVEVTLQLPAGSHLEAHTASCALRGVGRLGDVTFEGAYKEIKVDEAASLRLTAIDGSVEVDRLGGPAQVTTPRGDITIGEATRGTLVLRTHQGNITVGAASGVSAALDARTTYGRVTNALKNDGTTVLDIRATTDTGDISARSL
ncbi:hypothetical protein DN069_32330 [Streptacidiphilus pinicola]|uniref:DUF4097 domain-containing protein n=1 Tax=Streptacidiphilus pinicola TaxID=2219663 RepID=A0A2X0I9E3_9ACTN|nr:DUF4097 family beta strand repeat-containing protein [Streptacidiphilus pinicola]RAG81544.1 hypothetical protein DN069_32330 [Streptacidiphilus pinicola]